MKTSKVISFSILSTMLMLGGNAFAEQPACAEAQDDSWMAPEVLQEQIETQGYTVESLGVSEGYCYELTGQNVQGQDIKAYLDPVTGAVVQEDIVQ